MSLSLASPQLERAPSYLPFSKSYQRIQAKTTTNRLCIRIRLGRCTQQGRRRSVTHSTLLIASLLIRVTRRYPCPIIRVPHPIIGSFIRLPCTTFLAVTIRSSSYRTRNRTRLDTTLGLPRGAAHLARFDRELGPRRRRARARGHPRRASRTRFVHLPSFLTSQS